MHNRRKACVYKIRNAFIVTIWKKKNEKEIPNSRSAIFLALECFKLQYNSTIVGANEKPLLHLIALASSFDILLGYVVESW